MPFKRLFRRIHDGAASVWSALKNKLLNFRNRVSQNWSTFKASRYWHWCNFIRYWATVLILIWVGTHIGKQLEEHKFALELRYRIYNAMQKSPARDPYAKDTVLVLIGDDEYWTDKLARRSPIKRDYLAELIYALDKANPAVIAIDFDLASQTPEGRVVEHEDYKKETETFLKAVTEVSQNRKIVLPATVGFDDEGYYVKESDIHDGYDFKGGHVNKGYISLPYDYRMIPLSIALRDGTIMDSFSESIVRAFDTTGKPLECDQGEESVTYGGYLTPDEFKQFSANAILTTDSNTLRSNIANKIVIIGGAWNKNAYGRGPQVDMRFTPVGWIPGVFMHANWVEALLDRRTSKPLGETTKKIIEVLLALSTAIWFYLIHRTLWKVIFTVALILGLVIFAYFSWQNLGLFFDFVIPTVLVIGHAVYEQVKEWRSDAHKYVKLKAEIAQSQAGA